MKPQKLTDILTAVLALGFALIAHTTVASPVADSPAGNTAERTSAVLAAPDVSPPPGEGNPGFTTAEGLNAPKTLISGIGNSAFGWCCLFSDTTASCNTGLGAGILALNTGGGEYCQRRRRAHPEHGRDEEHREWSRCNGVQHYRQR